MAKNTSYYYNQHFSLPLVKLILGLLGKNSDDPSNPLVETGTREWYSQPRLGSTTTTECVTVTFRLPLSVSEISTEILRMPCKVELWYQDRSNNWRPILDMQQAPLNIVIDRSDTKSWYKWAVKCYPIVAKRVQFRLTRTNDAVLADVTYPVGLRGTLIRRNVYDRNHGGFFEDEVDIMGNVINKYIRDWDASQAADNNYTTFWKSAPMPDPAAVASLYLDVRDDDGGPTVIDKVYLDPVYAGQHLNLYYSSDDTVGGRTLSPITLAPPEPVISASGTVSSATTTTLVDDTAAWEDDAWAGFYAFTADGQVLTITGNDSTTLTFLSATVAPAEGSAYQIGMPSAVNVNQRYDRGLTDTATNPAADSFYRWPLRVGPLSNQDAWIGVDWRPNFASTASPSRNPVLFQSGALLNPTDLTDGYRVKLYYDVGSAEHNFVLQFSNGSGTPITYRTNSVDSTAGFVAEASLRIVAGWRYPDNTGKRVYLNVINPMGTVIASLDAEAPNLPSLITLDGVAQVARFQGTIGNLVVKLESPVVSSSRFQVNPSYYCDPDPVIPDDNGHYPSTSLDHAIYVAPFTRREHGSGGADRSHFEDKEWTPIWRDYVAIKGMLHLPQPISMKYLKLEFTNLTEQPYPVFESGIETSYRVFPLSVTQQSSIGPRLYTGDGGFLGMGTFISLNGVRSVNWLDPNSVLQAVGNILGPNNPPVLISAGAPYITGAMPNEGRMAIENSRRVEASNGYVYSRDTIQPYILAQNQYTTIIKADALQAIQPYVDVPWEEIEAANPGAITKVKTPGTMPIRGGDWWIYPGQQLKVPASVMQRITQTQTVTERKLTLESRVRFNTTQVHRYDWKTVKRDAAVAYFAGVREVQPYAATYWSGEDKVEFDFPSYVSDQWVLANHKTAYTGAVSAGQESLPATVTSRWLETQSDFSRVTVKFRDSGTVRSNSMWADIANNNSMIPDTDLSPYFSLISSDDAPPGFWKDSLATWKDANVVWGSPYALVSATVDDNRRYLGKRVVHFTREGGQEGRAGIKVQQLRNFSPGAQFRIGAVFYRPQQTNNTIRLTLRRTNGGGVIVFDEELTSVPVGRWHEAYSQWVEVPETLLNSSFDNNLIGWRPHGATWTAVDDEGRGSGTKSARLDTEGVEATLASDPMASESLPGDTAAATAWVKWTGLETGTTIYLNALMYDDNENLVEDGVVALDGGVAVGTADSDGWVPVSGTVHIPVGKGVTKLSFQLVVPAEAGSGGQVWVDDFTSAIPGAERQQYSAQLTVEGDESEELYVSDLYTEITPIRYYIALGEQDPIEVTDLSYKNGITTVTSTEPVNKMQVYAVITSPNAWAYGCTVKPFYLK